VKLIVIDADCKIRFERVAARATDTDKVDFDTFVEQERKEMSSADPSSQNVQRVMQMADYHLTNDGTLEDLHKQIEKICG
jgi:dephospho-CoA kinase